MGSSFANVQVFTGDQPVGQVRLEIIEALREWVLSGPFVEITGTRETADREILVGPAERASWIAVYDEFTEDGDLARVAELAQLLSSASHSIALAVLVHDSDVLELQLARDGEIIDTYSSRPDYFGRVSPRTRQELNGNPEAWKDLLIDNGRIQDLRDAFDEELLFADDTLLKVAQLIGLDTSRVRTGWRYLAVQPPEPGVARLAFHSTAPTSPLLSPDEPPAFDLGAFTERQEYVVGDRLALTASVYNTGGPSKGIMIVLAGNALDTGLVKLDGLQLSSLQTAMGGRRIELALEEHTVDGAKIQVARVGDLDIIPSTAATETRPDTQTSRRAFDAWQATQIYANISGQTLRPGQGTINIGFVPLANPEKGLAGAATTVEVFPPARHPLRYLPPGRSEFLRVMETPRYLVALAALGADRKTCARVACDAFERWASIISPQHTGYYHIVSQAEERSRPGIKRLPAKNIPRSKRWQDYRQALETCESLYARLSPEKSGDHWFNQGSGFAFDASSVFFHLGGDQLVPHVGLWLELAKIDTSAVDAAMEKLTALIDDMMLQASGLQAFVARWNWASWNAGVTPYEIACDVHGQCTTGRSWCIRYLRGVSERIWLGTGLLEWIGGLQPLQAIAQVTAVGPGVRLVLNQSASLDELELALAPLLPSNEDWLAGTQRLYRR